MAQEYNDMHQHQAAGSNARDISNLMFQPPVDLIFYATFEQALKKAKREDKLILVNVFDPASFPCQVLNRDLWSDQSKQTLKKL